MLIIYWKSDGEIHQVAPNYRTLAEFYGIRVDEYSLIFDAIYIDEVDYYIFNNFNKFKVINGVLTVVDNKLIELLKKSLV